MRAKTTDKVSDATMARVKGWWATVEAAVKDAWTKKDQAALDAIFAKAPTTDEMGVGSGGRDEEAHVAIAALNTKMTAFDALLPKLTKLVKDAEKDPPGDDDDDDDEEERKRKKKEREEKETTDRALGEEVPTMAKDRVASATDSAFLADAYQATAAGAEILVPGISIGTYDKAAAPKTTLDSICKLRRTALDLSYTTAPGRATLDGLLGGRKLDGLPCPEIRSVFNAAVTLKKAVNDAEARGAARTPAGTTDKSPKPIRSLAEMNQRNREKYGQK